MRSATRAVPARLTAVAALLMGGLISGCTVTEHLSVPSELASDASIAGLENIRTWADSFQGDFEAYSRGFAERLANRPAERANRLEILALSGGGQSGAWGAGILNGWTATGTRPQFDIVTGISTGAIIAPFAFLGPAYDPALKEIYTTTRTRDVGKPRIVGGLAGGEAIMDAGGFRKLIEKYLTNAMVEEIGKEWRKGRTILVGTTNLEAERGVIWDIGAIAASNYPGKAALIRDVIRASASIPGAFPPVQLRVSAGGQQFDELHADGGVTEQVFLYPSNVSIREVEEHIGVRLDKRVHVIRNTKLRPSFEELDPRTAKIVGRSLNTLIRQQGLADVRSIAALAERDGIEFRYTAIPQDFDVKSGEFFDPDYMKPLFSRGYDTAIGGNAWSGTAP